jgi:hypothetical protein
MKFIFADSLDQVDPHYDFIADRSREGRRPYWDDQYPHELLGFAPYEGILVSRGIVGDHLFKGKYTASQSMRFSRVGARAFLRFNGEKFAEKDLFGDCGAFSYVNQEKPPYTSEDMVQFYADGGFTHGCSVDHIIFDFERRFRNLEGGTDDARRRFEITLENARTFLRDSQQLGAKFTPLGVVQGWSPGSMAEAAARLEKMGYDYLALGGMVPLNATAIHECLQAVRERISTKVRLHLLGFAKAEQIHEFTKYGIASFDTTSPLIRAFKDARANYYVVKDDGTLDYYAAVRVPQALGNPRLLKAVKTGQLHQDTLVPLEATALKALRDFDAGKKGIEESVEAVLAYAKLIYVAEKKTPNEKALLDMRERTTRTLTNRPWKTCECPVCTKLSIEVVIFRGNNRNRRRGFHNLGVFHQHVKGMLAGGSK